MLASRVLELLWGMVMSPDAHADVVTAAIKGLRHALFSYDTSLDDSEVQPLELIFRPGLSTAVNALYAFTIL